MTVHIPSGIDLVVELLETKHKSVIPVLCFRVHNASFTILYSHGNATDCGAMFSRYLELAMKLRVNVVAYDYTGYGYSHGISPSENLTYQDIERVCDWCCSNIVNNPKRQLIILGQSVGSGPSCYLASKVHAAGLILISPIASGLRVLTDSRILSCFDIFPNIDRIKHVKCPVFIIHGDVSIHYHCNISTIKILLFIIYIHI